MNDKLKVNKEGLIPSKALLSLINLFGACRILKVPISSMIGTKEGVGEMLEGVPLECKDCV